MAVYGIVPVNSLTILSVAPVSSISKIRGRALRSLGECKTIISLPSNVVKSMPWPPSFEYRGSAVLYGLRNLRIQRAFPAQCGRISSCELCTSKHQLSAI